MGEPIKISGEELKIIVKNLIRENTEYALSNEAQLLRDGFLSPEGYLISKKTRKEDEEELTRLTSQCIDELVDYKERYRNLTLLGVPKRKEEK